MKLNSMRAGNPSTAWMTRKSSCPVGVSRRPEGTASKHTADELSPYRYNPRFCPAGTRKGSSSVYSRSRFPASPGPEAARRHPGGAAPDLEHSASSSKLSRQSPSQTQS